jgi:uncharacterized membrane protein SpoIIM required for sporulation
LSLDRARFCPNCGHPVIDPVWSSYCSNCGRPLPQGLTSTYSQTLGYPGKKVVYFERSLSKSYWLWRKNQALAVPTMLSSSIAVLSQSIFVIFGIILLVDLEDNGTLAQMVAFASKAEYSNLLSIFFSGAVLIPFATLIGAATIVAVVVSILANGFSLSAEYVSYRKSLEGRRVTIGEAIYAVKDKWKAMAWTSVLSILISYLPLGVASIGIAYALYASGGNVLALFGSLAFLLIGGLLSLLLSFFVMYSTISVAIEDVSGFAAIRKSFQRSSSYFGVSLTYALVRVGAYALISAIGIFGQFIGFPLTSLASIALTLLLVPVLHLTKTSIYREMTIPSQMEYRAYGETSAMSDLFRGSYARYVISILGRGLRTLGSFVFGKRNLIYHFCSALAFLIGVYVGSYVAINGLASAIFTLGYQSGQINPTILNTVPLSEGFDIFFHNWLVSLATALSGIWFVAPSLVTLGFNGVILGVVYHLTPTPTMFVAAIFPHGIIELPAFIIAGSTGMKLGVAFLRTRKSKIGSETSSGEIVDVAKERFYEVARETIYVVIGLAILFLIAGFIEGNITPIVMRAAGWH